MEKEATEKLTLRFLRTGRLNEGSAEELAVACDRLVDREAANSLKAALRMARRFVSRAEPHRGPLRLYAYRALARITHLSGAHRDALKAYRTARRLAKSDPISLARIDRALTDVYMYLGRFADSEKAARRAIRVFRKHKLQSDLARSQANYANLLHRQDRHREAAVIYRKAADFFETTDNNIALARCYYNLANSKLQLFEVDEARQLYSNALSMWTEAGCELDACDTRYGLAWLHMLTGQLHIAMVELTACENQYRMAGDPRGEALCALDRAEVLLHLGLATDALEAARVAERRFRKLKLRYELSKSALYRAQAALMLGHQTEALAELQKARSGFQSEKNGGFLGVVCLTQADLDGHRNAAVRQRLALANRYFKQNQLPLWQAVCDLKDAVTSEYPRPALKRLASNRAAECVPHLFAMWKTIQGDTEFRAGRSEPARECWQQAADRLDVVRAQLPPIELRTAYGQRRLSPHTRLVELELERDPLQAAVWSERRKTAGVWMPPALGIDHEARTQVEQSLQMLAGQFAALAHQITGVGGERGRAAQADSRIVNNIQRRIREELVRIEVGSDRTPARSELIRNQFQSLSRARPILQFHLRDADIIAFVHWQGTTEAHVLKNGRIRLTSALERWRFILEAELLPEYPGYEQRIRAEEALWEETAEWLWRPLGLAEREQTYVIIPEGELANLPWEALRVQDRPLGDSHYFILAPSIRHYAAARNRCTDASRVDIFRGAGDNLPYVDVELETLCHAAGSNACLHAPAVRNDWPVTGDSMIWHYSGHALLRSDNPFYSGLVLADGPLFAVDFRVRQCRVNLATLAACRSGEQVSLPGEESTGLVRSLLEMGARTVVAGRWPVSDRTAALWMKTFYNSLFEDSDILNASRKAASTVRAAHQSAFHWAAFAVFGSGDIGGRHDGQ